MKKISVTLIVLLCFFTIRIFAVSSASYKTNLNTTSGGGLFESTSYKSANSLVPIGGPIETSTVNLLQGILYVYVSVSETYYLPISIVFDSGQFQLCNINKLSDAANILVTDKRNKPVKKLNFDVTRIYPENSVEEVTYDVNFNDGYYMLSIQVPEKPGSYLYKVTNKTYQLEEYMEIETIERNFFKDKWMMFSTAVQTNSSFQDSLKSISDHTALYIWLPQLQEDEWGSKYDIPETISSGKSYWYKYKGDNVKDTITVTIDGAKIDDAEYKIQLYSGWNQVGNPYYYYIDWDSCLIKCNDSEYSPAQAESDSIIQNALYWYIRQDSGMYGYTQTPSLAVDKAFLRPYFGAWLFAYEDCELIFKGEPSIPTKEFLDTIPANLAPGIKSKDNWFIEVVANSEKYFDGSNFIGVSENSNDGYDVKDKFKAPKVLGGYVWLYFDHYGWNKYCDQFSSDIRKPVDTYKFWYFELASDEINQLIKLKWNNLGNIPDNYEIYLEEIKNHRIINMRQEQEYEIQTDMSGEFHRSFAVKVGIKEYEEELKKAININTYYADTAYVYPNPIKPGTPNHDEARFRIGLVDGSSGNVIITIFDISGQLVSEINLPLSVLNKTSTSPSYLEYHWNLLNDNGRAVGSGFYLYVMKITFDGNSINKTGKFSVIR